MFPKWKKNSFSINKIGVFVSWFLGFCGSCLPFRFVPCVKDLFLCVSLFICYILPAFTVQGQGDHRWPYPAVTVWGVNPGRVHHRATLCFFRFIPDFSLVSFALSSLLLLILHLFLVLITPHLFELLVFIPSLQYCSTTHGLVVFEIFKSFICI